MRARLNVVSAVSLGLIVLWGVWWVESFRADRLVFGEKTWVPVLPFLAGDFTVHIDHVARIYVAGANPYVRKGDWVCEAFPYPPSILRLFSWVSLVATPTAVRVWLVALAAILAVGAEAAWRTRAALRLVPIPRSAVLIAVLYATPAVYAMERGQCDPLVIPALMGVAWLLGRRTAWSDLAAGGALGLVAWVKYYPGLAVVAFLALRRWRALAAFVAVAGTIGAVDRAEVRLAIEHGMAIARLRPPGYPTLPLNHSIVAEWPAHWERVGSTFFQKVPGAVAAAVLLFPAAAVVALRIARVGNNGPEGRALLFPFLAWLTALATFAMPYSVDYNLVALPVAALAVWDRRDPLLAQLALGSCLVWWQPFALPVNGEVLLVFKLAALYAVGACLTVRAGALERDRRADSGAAIDRLFYRRFGRRGGRGKESLPMRIFPRGARPAGLIGMIGLVLVVELYISRHDRDYTTLWAQAWKWSRQAAGREAARSDVLCFGDSLVMHGVAPTVLEGRLGRPAYNLAISKGQGPSSYFLLRRALASGARPAAVLVDGELLDDDPIELTRLWPELASLPECAELAVAARSPGFLAAMALSKLLPTYRTRFEIRASVLAALAGAPRMDWTSIRPRRRNADVNRGAQVLPALPIPDGHDPRDATIASYRPGPRAIHPLNRVYVDRFLGLAAARGVPVFWLLLPYHPGIQSRREEGGWDASNRAYLADLQARFPNLNVVDARHSGYPASALADLTHLNRLGAIAFSDALGDVLRRRLDDPGSAGSSRWLTIPAYRAPVDVLGVEDVIASTEVLRRQYAGRAAVRR